MLTKSLGNNIHVNNKIPKTQ